MRKLKIEDLQEKVRSRRPQVDREILRQRGNSRPVRRRQRDEIEKELLTKILLRRWREAVETGKIQKRGPRRWYFDV